MLITSTDTFFIFAVCANSKFQFTSAAVSKIHSQTVTAK